MTKIISWLFLVPGALNLLQRKLFTRRNALLFALAFSVGINIGQYVIHCRECALDNISEILANMHAIAPGGGR